VKVWIFTPSNNAAISVPTALGMADAAAAMTLTGIRYRWKVQLGGCFIHVIRERAVQEFLASDYTDLVFLDDDIGFDAEGWCRLLTHDVDVVGAVCPKRGDGIACDREAPAALVARDYVGTGLLRIRRALLERLTGRLFDARWIGERFMGEDIAFCQKVQEAGGTVWVDGSIRVSHTGPYTWRRDCPDADAAADAA